MSTIDDTYSDSRELYDTPKFDNLIYDVGLHKGEDAEFYLMKGFRVVAFEADPDLIAACELKLASYLTSGQLSIVKGAIVDSDAHSNSGGEVEFYKNEKVSVWGTVATKWRDRNEGRGCPSQTIRVKVVDFVDALRTYGVPRYLKIDIEGCDIACVKALARFANRPDFVSLESDRTSYAGIKQEIEWLRRLGYDRFQTIEQSAVHTLQTPPNPPREGKYVEHRFIEGSTGLFGEELEGEWLSLRQVLRRYRFIRLGYWLLDSDGIMNRYRILRSWKLQNVTRKIIERRTKGNASGWYDTHARLGS